MSHVVHTGNNRHTVIGEGAVVPEIDAYLKAFSGSSLSTFDRAFIVAQFWNFLLDNHLDFKQVSLMKLVDFFCAVQLGCYIDLPSKCQHFSPDRLFSTPKIIRMTVEVVWDFLYYYSSSSTTEHDEDTLRIWYWKLLDIIAPKPQKIPPLLDLDLILQNCSSSRDRIIILLTTQLGLTIKEAIDLSLDDVEIARDRAVIVRSRTAKNKHHDRRVPFLVEARSRWHNAFSYEIRDYLLDEYYQHDDGDRAFLVGINPQRKNYGLRLNASAASSLFRHLRGCGHQVDAYSLHYHFVLTLVSKGLHVEYISRMLGIRSSIHAKKNIEKALLWFDR